MTDEAPDRPTHRYRRYDKGSGRYKHVGTQPFAVIEFDDGNPKKWVGKCPTGISDPERERLLNNAISGSNGDRDVDFPAKLYTVYNGTIYEGRTTTRGYSYHGFPYKGNLAQNILDMLKKERPRKAV